MPKAMLSLPYSLMSFSQARLPSTSWQESLPFFPPTNDQTCLPSVLHEAEASLALSGPFCAPPVLVNVFRHRSLPSMPTHSRTMSLSASEVRKIRSPHTHGVD